jgi:hypothetical protein
MSGVRPAQDECRRCEKLFCYFRLPRQHARRRYCTPCVNLERVDLLEFSKVQRRKRAAARAHADQSARHLSGYQRRGLSI